MNMNHINKILLGLFVILFGLFTLGGALFFFITLKKQQTMNRNNSFSGMDIKFSDIENKTENLFVNISNPDDYVIGLNFIFLKNRKIDDSANVLKNTQVPGGENMIIGMPISIKMSILDDRGRKIFERTANGLKAYSSGERSINFAISEYHFEKGEYEIVITGIYLDKKLSDVKFNIFVEPLFKGK